MALFLIIATETKVQSYSPALHEDWRNDYGAGVRSARRVKELMNPARQFGIKDMQLKIVRVRIVWEVTRGGLRPTWSL